MRLSDKFTRTWISFGLPDVREAPSTYEGTDHAKLPRLPALLPELEWLSELPSAITEYGMKHDSFVHNEVEMKAVSESLRESQPFKVSESFWKLLANISLQNRIPTCTACYFDLPKAWTKSPFREGDWILRFMNDQQCCFCWYLYLSPDEEPFVIVGSGAGEEVFLDDVDFSSDATLLADAWERTFYVAEGFEEFIYRFWIENLIWFKMKDSITLNANELNYVRQIAPDYQPVG